MHNAFEPLVHNAWGRWCTMLSKPSCTMGPRLPRDKKGAKKESRSEGGFERFRERFGRVVSRAVWRAVQREIEKEGES